MADPFTDVTVSSYNANPPSDDGSEVSTNEITWAGIKTKLTDPLNTALGAFNTNVGAAIDKIIGGGGVTTDGAGATLTASIQGKLVRQTASGITTTFPDATSVASPFVFAILNDGGGNNTLATQSSQTINGNSTITLPDQRGAMAFTDGANWFLAGLPNSNSAVFTGDSGSGGAAGLVPAPSATYGAKLYSLFANGNWGATFTLQYFIASTAATTSLSTNMPEDDTAPTITEGTQVLSQAITPHSTSSKIYIHGQVKLGASSDAAWGVAIWRTVSGSDTLVDVTSLWLPNAHMGCISFDTWDSPATTSACTYSVRVGSASVTGQLNGNGSARRFGGAALSKLFVEERGF